MNRRTSPSSRGYKALMQLLRTADELWNASRVFFARWDIGPSQFNVLNLLYLRRSGCSQSELSRQLVMHRSNVTGLIDRLEKRGLVARKEVANDRRAYRVVLTPEGRNLIAQILPRYYEAASMVWDSFPPERPDQLLTDLKRLADSAHRITSVLTKNNPRAN